MANWREIIISGSDAHLNSLNADTSLTASGITYPDADGTNEQVLQTDGSGNLSFTDKDSGAQGATVNTRNRWYTMVHKVLMETE